MTDIWVKRSVIDIDFSTLHSVSESLNDAAPISTTLRREITYLKGTIYTNFHSDNFTETLLAYSKVKEACGIKYYNMLVALVRSY